MVADEFAHMSLDDLRTMLREVLRDPAPSDRDFIRRLTNAIAAREKSGQTTW